MDPRRGEGPAERCEWGGGGMGVEGWVCGEVGVSRSGCVEGRCGGGPADAAPKTQRLRQKQTTASSGTDRAAGSAARLAERGRGRELIGPRVAALGERRRTVLCENSRVIFNYYVTSTILLYYYASILLPAPCCVRIRSAVRAGGELRAPWRILIYSCITILL